MIHNERSSETDSEPTRTVPTVSGPYRAAALYGAARSVQPPCRTQPARWETIKQVLESRGLWNADGIGRKARARYCTKCRAPVIAGLDDERSAMVVFVDPDPALNATGEVIALMQGRRTYSLRWLAGRYEIDHRDSYRIQGDPAGSRGDMEILVLHNCIPFFVPDSALARHIERQTSTFGDDLDQPPF